MLEGEGGKELRSRTKEVIAYSIGNGRGGARALVVLCRENNSNPREFKSLIVCVCARTFTCVRVKKEVTEPGSQERVFNRKRERERNRKEEQLEEGFTINYCSVILWFIWKVG